MKKTIRLVLMFFTLVSHGLTGKTVCILIHGTWAASSTWNTPDGGFFNVLEQNLASLNIPLVSFLWTGKNHHEDRVKNAKRLVKWIRSYPDDHDFIFVTHSHGSNVGILASQQLDELNGPHIISGFYALGTPVDAERYMPNMNVIQYFFNFFSFEDIVQPVLGIFDREYPAHERIANLRTVINGEEPKHSQLHHKLIARWIPYFHKKFSIQGMSSYKDFTFNQPGIMHFDNKTYPTYIVDTNRHELHERDAGLHHYLLSSFSGRAQERALADTYLRSIGLEEDELAS